MFYRSLKYAARGIAKTFRTQANFRIMTVCFLLVVIAGFVFGLSGLEWAVVLLCCGGVLGFEMLNTAIECAVDMIKPELHPLAEKTKDIAAGFVLVFSIFSLAAGLVIFIPHIIKLF